jgi:hypothetical protein
MGQAGMVSLSAMRDDVVNVYVAVRDLIEHRPIRTDRSGPEPLPDELRACIESLGGVAGAPVWLREVGHMFFGEVFVTPRGSSKGLPAKIRCAMPDAKTVNWRLHDVTITVLDRPLE